jgi:hypothetical protein
VESIFVCAGVPGVVVCEDREIDGRRISTNDAVADLDLNAGGWSVVVV